MDLDSATKEHKFIKLHPSNNKKFFKKYEIDKLDPFVLYSTILDAIVSITRLKWENMVKSHTLSIDVYKKGIFDYGTHHVELELLFNQFHRKDQGFTEK